MFIRHSMDVTALIFAGLISACPAMAQSSPSHLFESKDHYAGSVAHEIASFEDGSFVTSLAFSADGKLIATNFSQVGGVRIWQWASPGRLLKSLQKPPFTGTPGLWDTLRFSADGRILAAADQWNRESAGGTYCRFWDAKNWAIVHDLAEPRLTFRGLWALLHA
jgi:WD40 repeat protein